MPRISDSLINRLSQSQGGSPQSMALLQQLLAQQQAQQGGQAQGGQREQMLAQIQQRRAQIEQLLAQQQGSPRIQGGQPRPQAPSGNVHQRLQQIDADGQNARFFAAQGGVQGAGSDPATAAPAPTQGVPNQPGLPQQQGLVPNQPGLPQQPQLTQQQLAGPQTAASRNIANASIGTPTSFQEPVAASTGDLTQFYNNFERRQLNDARKRDFNSSLGSKSIQERNKFDPTANEQRVRDRIDPKVQARLDKRETKLAARTAKRDARRAVEDAKRDVEDERLRKERIALSPAVTAMVSAAREDARASGKLFDEKEALKIVKERLGAGKTDPTDIVDLIDDAKMDKVLKRMEKVNKIREAVELTPSKIDAQIAKDGAEIAKAAKITDADPNRAEAPPGLLAELGKKVAAIDTGLQYAKDFQESFDPEFYQSIPQMKANIAIWAEQKGAKLTPEQKQTVARFSQWKRKMTALFNIYVKETTGATVRSDEEPRIRAQIINGEMSPTQAAATILGMIEELNESRARAVDILKHKGIPLQSPTKSIGLGAGIKEPTGGRDKLQQQLGQGPAQVDPQQQLNDIRQRAEARLEQLRGRQ